MKYFFHTLWILAAVSCGTANPPAADSGLYHEPHRPQIHFSPKEKWMNDPNGMVYSNGTWHLFFQYYPDSTVWGPMHWGHATSKDLVHWTQQPIALYPDTLGYIFSGSVVADVHNTSGFGSGAKTPLVAIFTHHDPKGEKQGAVNFQNQSIAYSTDEGVTWTKYAGNPVLKNPGTKDFRDPKVSWNDAAHKWIMTLAMHDRIGFFSSTDLKNWTKESEFGEHAGSHGGVWECPDLFPMKINGKTVWVLLVSINPGGPQGGSATQYFIGDFDGKTFTSNQADTRWVDAGTDNYAGVTWSNTGDRKVFLGWMSNWQYAQVVPTSPWRSAMTVPRELSLVAVGNDYYLRSFPVKELDVLNGSSSTETHVTGFDKPLTSPARIAVHAAAITDFRITLSNSKGQQWVAGYESATNRFFIDRTLSGNTGFEKGFASRIYSKRIATTGGTDITLVIDNASAELFADAGVTTMTSVFFPDAAYDHIKIDGLVMDSVSLTPLKGIWNQ